VPGDILKTEISCEAILNASRNGVIGTDTAGRLVFVNNKALEIMGAERREVMGVPISKLLPETGGFVLKNLETGESQLSQHSFDNSSGLLVNVTSIEERGVSRGAVAVLQDMDEFEHAATKLKSFRQLNTQLNAMFESSPDGICVCDHEGRMIRLNRASEELIGARAEDIIGKNTAELEGVLFDQSVSLEVIETGKQISKLQYEKKTRKHLLITGTPVFDEEGDISLVILYERDITQLNVVKEQLEQSRMITQRFKDELQELSMKELKEQDIVAESKATQNVLKIALKLAKMDVSPVLILGESGTGKGLLSKFIHNAGKGRKGPFIQINCAALPEGLLEAELFGYEKGAFTGARTQGKIGLFELARGGTIFLDEIGDIPLSIQAKLLKCLDDFEITHLGGLKPIPIDCTIIAATNRDIESMVKRGDFRSDLFYRLNTFSIHLSPMRERREDVFELARFFLKKFNQTYGTSKRFSARTFDCFQSYAFPGNVRELSSIIKKAVVLCEDELLDEFILKAIGSRLEKPPPSVPARGSDLGLEGQILEFEKEILKKAIKKHRSTRKIAKHLKTSQSSVIRRLKKHDLS
jgi:PAS domain S-box-containing protein/TyrR family helix-turn-helix protein